MAFLVTDVGGTEAFVACGGAARKLLTDMGGKLCVRKKYCLGLDSLALYKGTWDSTFSDPAAMELL